MELTVCPEVDCPAVAEVVDRWLLGSTHGPVAHVRTRCLYGHVLTQIATPVPESGPAGR